MVKQIPNIITSLRILLTPFFAWLYIASGGGKDRSLFFWALLLLAVIMISDIIDGKIARRFDLQSRLGEILDPVADKLAQITICVCLCVTGVAPLWFMLLLVLKEGTQLVLGVICIKKGVPVQKARWYGKMSTAVFYVVICFNLVFPDGFMFTLPAGVRSAMYIGSMALLYFSFFNYMYLHIRIYRDMKKNQAQGE